MAAPCRAAESAHMTKGLAKMQVLYCDTRLQTWVNIRAFYNSLAFRTTATILDLPKNEIKAFLDTKCGDLSDKTSVIAINWL